MKGRSHDNYALGERAGASKLTEVDALKIRGMPGTYREIAAQFGISHNAVGNIKNRVTWKHI